MEFKKRSATKVDYFVHLTERFYLLCFSGLLIVDQRKKLPVDVPFKKIQGNDPLLFKCFMKETIDYTELCHV